MAVENARRKARAVAVRRPDARVLGADTVVAIGGLILPKPTYAEQARQWLLELSGRTHDVLGGVCLREPGGERSAVEVTRVTFRRRAEEEVSRYVDTGEWRERAGGYAIQGRGGELVAEIEGSYSNVVGLPKDVVRRLLMPD